MNTSNTSKFGAGTVSAVAAYTIWGVLPIYWKFVNTVPALEILAHRIVWSLVFLAALQAVTGRIGATRREIAAIIADGKRFGGVVIVAILVSLNWLVYIWAVNDNRIVETSLGYYINPLVSVLLGVVILKERLSFWPTVAVTLAGAGVLNLTLNGPAFPWVALFLAVTFGLYGLGKKLLGVGAITGIILETLILAPAALVYLVWIHATGGGAFSPAAPATALLLLGTGVVTAVPMVLFANSANHLPLTILGFIQFLSPTLALLVGVFLYGETFSSTHLTSFVSIWMALAIFLIAKAKTPKTAEFVTGAANNKKDLP